MLAKTHAGGNSGGKYLGLIDNLSACRRHAAHSAGQTQSLRNDLLGARFLAPQEGLPHSLESRTASKFADPFFCFLADGPQQPNPQGTINTIGSVVQAAGSLASAQQALTSAGSAAGTGDILQTVGQAAQAMQVGCPSSIPLVFFLLFPSFLGH